VENASLVRVHVAKLDALLDAVGELAVTQTTVILEALADPLMHLIRNAVDHGVESPEARMSIGKPPRANVTLTATHQGGSVVVEVRDDGSGLNYRRIMARGRERGLLKDTDNVSEQRLRELIFEPGFSTAHSITDLSGRGVGLDVVKRSIEALGGRVVVRSQPEQSTTFSLHLPLTLAIMDGLIAAVGSERFIIPAGSVIESIRPVRGSVTTVHERGELLSYRETHLPIVRLYEFANLKPKTTEPYEGILIIVDNMNERCALMADALLGMQQVVIKSLGDSMHGARGIAAGAILDDGRVGLILDVAEVLQSKREMQLEST